MERLQLACRPCCSPCTRPTISAGFRQAISKVPKNQSALPSFTVPAICAQTLTELSLYDPGVAPLLCCGKQHQAGIPEASEFKAGSNGHYGNL